MILYTLLVLAEIPMAIFGAWCILNEEKLIDFEDRLSNRIIKRIKHR